MSGQFVHLMKLGMGRNPNVDVTVSIGVLIEALEFYFKKGEAIAYIVGTNAKSTDPVNESNAIYIASLDTTDTNTISMLLVRGDPERGTPAYVNPKTRKILTISSSDPSAVRAASAHIVVSRQEIAGGGDQGRYRMAMEQSTGISRILARDLLGTLLAKFAEERPSDFQAEKKRVKRGEKPETIAYRPTVRFHPHENASLKDDLKDGKIGGFRLVRGRTTFQGDADEPKIEKLNVQLHARIEPTDNFSKVRSLVDSLQQQLDAISFEDLKLELIDEDGLPLPIPGRINLDEESSDADMRYCKRVRITGLKDVPPECVDDFHPEITKFTRNAVLSNEHWS